MTNEEIISKYIPIVHFIADICGPRYEVVLHDISKPENSVIAIRNSYISGRKIGSPMTDLALKIIKQKDYLTKDFITNYDGFGKNGRKFLSSTYFIKNDENKLIGMICINNDISDILDFKNNFGELLSRFSYCEKNNAEHKYKEHIENSVVSLANSIIHRTINKLNIPPERMSIEEKVKIVHELNDSGIFLLKGGASDVANELKISETTIYRYLNKKL